MFLFVEVCREKNYTLTIVNLLAHGGERLKNRVFEHLQPQKLQLKN